ncbi:unnamed protein product [Lepeophtheirus salmonis]|uniref:(salmon louse) hypothetical protein n=1 Tax=Lepeophtheirus salmonis TaxID=72036 RepID=A0A7R8H499_LEPSM|nr:unnamed protein product [Lepeophtheirus salmonis]CAF2846510.1 unnamed protein product [Lepeophtheirus salmonis]
MPVYWSETKKPDSEEDHYIIQRPREKEDSFSVSSLILQTTKSSDSGRYECNPSNTAPASIFIHILNGESPDALQTSGLSTFSMSPMTVHLILFNVEMVPIHLIRTHILEFESGKEEQDDEGAGVEGGSECEVEEEEEEDEKMKEDQYLRPKAKRTWKSQLLPKMKKKCKYRRDENNCDEDCDNSDEESKQSPKK